MAKLDRLGAQAFITHLRDLCEGVRQFPTPVIARIPVVVPRGGTRVGDGLRYPNRSPRHAVWDARGESGDTLGYPRNAHATPDW